jgi:hypothetical protein
MSRFERWSRAKRGLPVDDEVKGEASSAESAATETASAKHAVKTAEAESAPPEASKPNHRETESNEADEAPPVEAPPASGELDHTLPDPDTLAAGSDFSAFMAPGVSSALRRKALRRLWATGDYNVRDGLNDYDHDFKAAMKPMAAEMADKVRQWTKKVEDALEEPATDEPEDKSDTQVLEETAEETPAQTAKEVDDHGSPYPNVEQHEREKPVGK